MKAWRLHNMSVGKKSPNRIRHTQSRTYNSKIQSPASDILYMLMANVGLPVPEAWREAMKDATTKSASETRD